MGTDQDGGLHGFPFQIRRNMIGAGAKEKYTLISNGVETDRGPLNIMKIHAEAEARELVEFDLV